MVQNSCCCGLFTLKIAIYLITLCIFLEALFIFNTAILSSMRGDLISMIEWGIFAAYMVCVVSLIKAICNDTRQNRKQATFSIIAATFIMVMLIFGCFIWIFTSFETAFPYMKSRHDKE